MLVRVAQAADRETERQRPTAVPRASPPAKPRRPPSGEYLSVTVGASCEQLFAERRDLALQLAHRPVQLVDGAGPSSFSSRLPTCVIAEPTWTMSRS